APCWVSMPMPTTAGITCSTTETSCCSYSVSVVALGPRPVDGLGAAGGFAGAAGAAGAGGAAAGLPEGGSAVAAGAGAAGAWLPRSLAWLLPVQPPIASETHNTREKSKSRLRGERCIVIAPGITLVNLPTPESRSPSQ